MATASPKASGSPRRGRLPPIGALIVVLMVAACAPRKPPPAPPPPPPPVEDRPAPLPPDAAHKVAILVPLSGPNAPVGASLANAATLALADTGKAGIRLTRYDTEALGAAGAASRALADGAELILGPLLASDIPAVRAAAGARGVTVLSFSNDAALAGGPVHVLGFQPAQSVARVVAHAASRGTRRFAGLIPDGTYGQRVSLAFTRAVNGAGGQVTALVNFPRQPAALPAAARRVTDHDARQKQAGQALTRPDGTVAPVTTRMAPIPFEALLVADSGTMAAAFLPALARFGAPAGSYLMLGTELWATEPGLRQVQGLHGALFAAVPDQRFRSMAARYRARFGAEPSRLASLGYDAMLLAAANAGGSWALGKPFPASVLDDPKGFSGIDGIFRFRGQVAERGLAVMQVGAGGFSIVSPAPTSF